MLTQQKINALRGKISSMPPAEKLRVLELLEEFEKRKEMGAARDSFTSFIKHVYPNYKFGAHHKKLIALFEAIARGEKKRIIVNIAPRHGKSELISYLAPAWFLGKFPEKKIIMTSHTADLAVDFGRRVRNLVSEDAYKQVFQDVTLQQDSKSAARWGTNKKGEYFAIGVGGALAGRGGDLILVDDPHSEQEAKTGRPEVFKPVWEWFQSGPLQRLMPGGAIIIVMCMTGDTDVLMADGSTVKLKDIRQGDEVATYEDGKITTAKINNQRSNGVDSVFTIKTQSGRIIRANKRHPFLVDFAGERKWIRLRDLTPGMLLVATKIVRDPQDHKQNPDCAQLASPALHITEKTLTPPTTHPDTTVNGKGLFAKLKGVLSQSKLKVSARLITMSSTFHPNAHQKRTEKAGSSTGMASQLISTKRWLYSGATGVMSAVSRLRKKIPAPTGTANFVSTIATIPARFAGFFATIATSLLDMEKPQKCLKKPLSIYDVATDQIISITPDGEEEVFDVEVERTENFIANGVVSHNTRWSKLDLTGQIIDHMAKNPDGDQWEIVELPAILNEGEEDEKSLWPEFWPLEELKAKKIAMDSRYWQSQYMQNPTSEEGAIIKREWWNIWEEEKPPDCDFTIMSLDAAQETNNRADYNALTTWGVFTNEETGVKNIILLNSIKERLEFPELKKLVLAEYKEWEPDTFIVEKKSNGAALYQELRSMGVPVSEFTPSKGQDKVTRANAVADIFSSGMVWAPDTRWAREVVEEVASFPFGKNDDLVDSMTAALIRFRKAGFLTLPSDEPEEVQMFRNKRRGGFY